MSSGKVYTDDTELSFAIIGDAKKAMDELTEEMWSDLKDLIDVNIYNSYQPILYDRTGEFENSWEWDNLDTGNIIMRSLYSHADEMKVMAQENGWIAHGSVSPRGKDMREALDVILNEEPWQKSLVGKLHGSYWNAFRQKWTDDYIAERFNLYMERE